MALKLTNRVAVVTGASRGIGLPVPRALVGEGANVVAGARTTEGLDKLERVTAVAIDLATPQGPAALVQRALDAHGTIDILVNNVGAAHPRVGGFASVTDEDWMAALNINFLAAVRTTRAPLPHLLARGAGNIVTICSVNSFLPDPLVIDYSAAKAALANFSKALSKEVGPRGIRVNTISPGPVSTGLWLGDNGVAATVANARGGDPQSVAKHSAADSVTGRFTEP